MLKVGVVGVAGRMGRMLAEGVIASDDMVLGGATEIEGHSLIGTDVGFVIGSKPLQVALTSDLNQAFGECSIIIDFSLPKASMKNVWYASIQGKAMVIGTTGFSDEQKDTLIDLAGKIPIVMAPNMSIGVNVMFKAVGMLTEMLGEDYDIEIVETHHRFKKDAPSGTAKGLAQRVAQARGVELSDHARYERNGIIGERSQGEIGIQTLRAGDIVGEHTVLFAGTGERIEITHRAHSRENFAKGALRAAKWLDGKGPGLYSMIDVLGL